jgi:hypothetical protein
MILAFELLSLGTHHGPANSATLQTIAYAATDQTIRVHAHASHIAELRGDPLLTGNQRIEFVDVALSPHYLEKSQVVSIKRFWREFVTLLRALRQVRRREFCLLVMLSTTPTLILAASLIAATGWRRVGTLVCLHGNIASLTGWRSRNPVIRRLDLHAMLARRHRLPLRYLVFEPSVRQELGKLVPEAPAYTDVLPHPANPAEIVQQPSLPLQYPVRIGLVGQATEAKGITPFLATARQFKQRHGDRVEFYLIGRVFPGDDISRFAGLDGPVSTEPIARHAFRELLGRLHFVFLPLRPEYYRLAASGALLDAITWLKPVIATDIPIVADMFTHFGDIGYRCSSTDEMQQALESVLTSMDPARYAGQVDAMRRAREARLPKTLARVVRRLFEVHFPELVQARAQPGDAKGEFHA